MQGINYDLGSSLLQNPAGTTVATIASAGTFNSSDQTNTVRRGIKVVVNITAISGTTPSLTVSIQGKDPLSGAYYTILASAALTATGTTILTVYPGIGVAANVSSSDVLPTTWRVQVVVAGTTPSVTATIGASLIL